MSTWKWFNEKDDPLIIGLDPELVSMLDNARNIAGTPFVISSGKRSVEGNSILKGAVSDSSHLTGKAVDLAVGGSREYFLMMKGLYAAGFRRIGQYLNATGDDAVHLHVDIDESKDQDVIFSKREQN